MSSSINFLVGNKIRESVIRDKEKHKIKSDKCNKYYKKGRKLDKGKLQLIEERKSFMCFIESVKQPMKSL